MALPDSTAKEVSDGRIRTFEAHSTSLRIALSIARLASQAVAGLQFAEDVAPTAPDKRLAPMSARVSNRPTQCADNEDSIMKRHYFISDDLSVVATVERDLLSAGVAAERIHVLSLDDADAEQHQLHDVQSLMKKDVVHSAEIGALVGLAAATAAIAIGQFSGLVATVGWVPFICLAIVLLGFFTWEGGLIGIQMPNARFRRFEAALRAGAHVFFVDVSSAEEAAMLKVLSAYPQLRPAGTGSSSPRWLLGVQQSAHRFFQWAP